MVPPPLLLLMSLSLGMECANSWVATTSVSLGTGAANTRALSLPLSCDAVKPFFESQGFATKDIPKEPLSSTELKTCGGISSGGEVCCSVNMEARLQAMSRDRHEKAIKDILQRLQNILHSRALKFHDFFNDLLKTSKKSFHEMFKKTYGILYEQNAYVFIDLYQELEKYYIKGSVNLDDVMDTFFNTLYQKMFTVLNSQYKFGTKYLECVSRHMKDMRPFGDVPQKLGVQIKRSFIATRAFSQGLQIATEVLKNMQQLKTSNECAEALTRMTVCPFCIGIGSNVLACNGLCENVMNGCLSQHAILDPDWNHFLDAVDKVADRLLGPFNIEMLVRPINLKISEAIMNFQESSSNVSQRIFTGCGRPVLGRRRRRRRINLHHNLTEIDDKMSLSFEDHIPEHKNEQRQTVEDGDERSSSAIILEHLVKEIKQRLRDSRQFWLYLPYKLCHDGLVVPPSNTNKCWNGTHIDKYIYPLSTNVEPQSRNPEVATFRPRAVIIREQIFALNSISNRLRSAFNGHDVDWIDNEENWSFSGSGSGSGSSDPTTDDEDGFAEESSGLEPTSRPSNNPDKIEKKKKQEDKKDSALSPPLISVIEQKYNNDHNPVSKSEHDVKLNNEIHLNNSQMQVEDVKALATSFSREFTNYLLPVFVVFISRHDILGL